MNFKCPNCHNSEGVFNNIYGVLPCPKCQEKLSTLGKPKKQLEYTSESIRQQRKEFGDDIIQPHRKGQLSKEYVKVYGAEAVKKMGFNDKEIAKAKNVWNDDKYYKENT